MSEKSYLSPLEEALVDALQHIAESTAASWVQDFANDAIVLADKTALERRTKSLPTSTETPISQEETHG